MCEIDMPQRLPWPFTYSAFSGLMVKGFMPRIDRICSRRKEDNMSVSSDSTSIRTILGRPGCLIRLTLGAA